MIRVTETSAEKSPLFLRPGAHAVLYSECPFNPDLVQKVPFVPNATLSPKTFEDPQLRLMLRMRSCKSNVNVVRVC